MDKLKIACDALKFVAYRGQHSGIIPCPQDYSYYVTPMQDAAREALGKIFGGEEDSEGNFMNQSDPVEEK